LGGGAGVGVEAVLEDEVGLEATAEVFAALESQAVVLRDARVFVDRALAGDVVGPDDAGIDQAINGHRGLRAAPTDRKAASATGSMGRKACFMEVSQELEKPGGGRRFVPGALGQHARA
jgi:hypothetical protein